MEIMMATFAGLFVLAMLVAILHWIDGRKPPWTNPGRKAPSGKITQKNSKKSSR